jgi:hypothetical protein
MIAAGRIESMSGVLRQGYISIGKASVVRSGLVYFENIDMS